MLRSLVVVLALVVNDALCAPATEAVPTVQLGKTEITGQAFPQFGQEFFGGMSTLLQPTSNPCPLMIPLHTQSGIPFAEPPVGSLRFAPPKLKLNPGVTQLNAAAFGPDCFQFNLEPASYGIAEVSEDCLFVNVFRPAGVDENARLPVLTWIYGGGFLCMSKFFSLISFSFF